MSAGVVAQVVHLLHADRLDLELMAQLPSYTDTTVGLREKHCYIIGFMV